MNKEITNNPPKGTSDWLPEEFAIRQYIFDTWKKVCQLYGFEEYLTPLLENAQIYKAKSGEDVGNKELMIITDRAGRELAIRPEMTPSVTRLVSKIYNQEAKPIKLYSVANFFRNEKPQRGRNREFWQLNCDIFGSDSLEADREIMQMALDIMLAFKAPKNSFKLYMNSRDLIESILDLAEIKENNKLAVIRLMDKWDKMKKVDIEKTFKDINVTGDSFKLISKFMNSKNSNELLKKLPQLKKSQGLNDINIVMQKLSALGYGDYISFNPAVIRGLDYYDGLVFELFDLNKDNNRAMFGGGRYNSLADIFGQKSFSAVGFAPGDETIKLFLESWNLLKEIKKEEKYYLPLLDEGLRKETTLLAQKLREKNYNVEEGLEVSKIGKALEYANKKNIDKVIILGDKEYKEGKYKIKNMLNGEEVEINILNKGEAELNDKFKILDNI
ncbi:MAG TPA: histidine--tRNA ligase [Patescibacteria group bacterium]|nr:histidine--tRNA ligase [Patescibacteria group bacterium]